MLNKVYWKVIVSLAYVIIQSNSSVAQETVDWGDTCAKYGGTNKIGVIRSVGTSQKYDHTWPELYVSLLNPGDNTLGRYYYTSGENGSANGMFNSMYNFIVQSRFLQENVTLCVVNENRFIGIQNNEPPNNDERVREEL